MSQPLIDEVFRLKEIGATGKAWIILQARRFPKLLEIQLPKPPDFTVSRPAAEKDYVEVKARELMQAEVKKISEEGCQIGRPRKGGSTAKAHGQDYAGFQTCRNSRSRAWECPVL